MQVWIDQDCCTGAGLCVDHCPDLFVVLEDGIGYVHEGGLVVTDATRPTVHVPRRHEQAAIDAVERCPGECIYVEPDGPHSDTEAGIDIVDADIVEPEIVDAAVVGPEPNWRMGFRRRQSTS